MNHITRTSIAALLCAAVVSAQSPGTAALQRAQVLEQQEGDLAAAEQAYRAILDGGDAAVQGQVLGQAALRLGSMLWRLDRKDDGRPLLERAVAAGGDLATQATAVLQGQGEAAKQEQERLVRARALVQQILRSQAAAASGQVAPADNGAQRDVLWLGDAGVRAIKEAIRQHWQRDPEAPFALIPLLWHIGTPSALEFLLEVADDSQVNRRRMVTANIQRVADDLFPAVVRFLHDPDPAGEVQRNLEPVLHKLPLATLVELIADKHPAARAAGLFGLASVWDNLTEDERGRTFSTMGDAVRRALHDEDARVTNSAWRLLGQFVHYGPRNARRLVLAEIANYPTGLGTIYGSQNSLNWPLDDEEMALLVTAAHTLGSTGGRAWQQLSPAESPIVVLVAVHQPEWSASSIDALLDLVALGYCKYSGSDPNWQQRFFALANPSQVLRLIRLLPHIVRPNEVLQKLARTALPNDALPALREVVEAVLLTPPTGWSQTSGNGTRHYSAQELSQLLLLIGQTKSAEAAVWLTDLIDREPTLFSSITAALGNLSADGVGEPASIGLRKVLVAEGTPEVPIHGSTRSTAFAGLARLGDEPAIALYPRAYELGLGGTFLVNPRRPQQKNEQASGIAFLGRFPDAMGHPSEPAHGYSDEKLGQAWGLLLDSKSKALVWGEVLRMKDRIPLAVLPVLAPRLPAHLAEEPMNRGSLYPVLDLLRQLTPELFAAEPRYVEAVRTLLQCDDTELASLAFTRLPRRSAESFTAEAHALLARSDCPGYVVGALRQAGGEPTLAEWQRALSSSDRIGVLDELPAHLGDGLRALVEERARLDGSVAIRAKACTVLANHLATDAVGILLEALRDPSDEVRKAATEALERIRFHQEQRAYWQNAKAGIDTSPASAAAKLIAQAQPAEDKSQRLLAIRSLAVLAAAESLPYLIDWTKDKDAEIAAAAREAVAHIHSALPGAPGKK